MKRTEAFRKLRSICHQLDTADPASLYYEPKAMYLFSSVLTSGDPDDIDLLLVHTSHVPDGDAYTEIMTERKHQHFIAHIRQRMRHISLESKGALIKCKQLIVLTDGAPVRCVWRPGLDWHAILTDIEAHPLPDAELSPSERAAFTARWLALSDEERAARLIATVARCEQS